MTKFPRSEAERNIIARRGMSPLSAGGHSAMVSREPRELHRPGSLPFITERVQYSAAGAVAVGVDGEISRYTVKDGGFIDEIHGHLATAGSSSTVITWYLNGSSIGTVTLVSSDTDQTDSITSVKVVAGDHIHSRITTAGTGAKGPSSDIEIKG